MEYILHLAIMILIYTLLAQSLNLAAGHTGLISLAHAGFYGIGAYTTAILSVKFGYPIWLNIPIAILICGTIACIVSLIALRTVEDYFIICTLGIQVIIYLLLNNWTSLTRGPMGISGIPPVRFFGLSSGSRIYFLLLTLFFVAVCWKLFKNMAASGFGLILIAISEDEIYTTSLGKDVYASKIIAFTISASLAAIPGSLYAHYVSYIDPTSFTVNESIFILSIVIIGGPGSLKGSLFASAFMILLPEALRFIGMPEDIAANMRQIIYGFILVVIMKVGADRLKAPFFARPHNPLL
jgi:branched-chain amino acid transport system permease protein